MPRFSIICYYCPRCSAVNSRESSDPFRPINYCRICSFIPLVSFSHSAPAKRLAGKSNFELTSFVETAIEPNADRTNRTIELFWKNRKELEPFYTLDKNPNRTKPKQWGFLLSHLHYYLHGNGWPWMTWNCCNFDKHDKLTQCCRAFTLALARLSCYTLDKNPNRTKSKQWGFLLSHLNYSVSSEM